MNCKMIRNFPIKKTNLSLSYQAGVPRMTWLPLDEARSLSQGGQGLPRSAHLASSRPFMLSSPATLNFFCYTRSTCSLTTRSLNTPLMALPSPFHLADFCPSDPLPSTPLGWISSAFTRMSLPSHSPLRSSAPSGQGPCLTSLPLYFYI